MPISSLAVARELTSPFLIPGSLPAGTQSPRAGCVESAAGMKLDM